MSKVYEKVDGSNDTLEGTENIESSPGAETKKEKPETESSIGPAPFSAFFHFMSAKEIILLCTGIFFAVAAGAVMPSINIVFGEIIDSIASPADTENLINRAVVMMTILAGIGFVTFTLGFFCINWAASLLANNVRMAYLDAVLRQDAIFFDGAPPGSISLALSDAPMEIQHGFSDKFALAIQGVAQLIVGFGIAFYFGWQLSLVLLACVPFLALAAVGLMSSDVSTFGKDAYEEANEVALETLSNMRTIVSLNAEVSRAESYNGKLAITQTAAIRAGVWAAFVMGCLWLVMFSMYGLGFWYGAFLIAQSTDDAIQEHPAPAGLFNTNATESVWATHAYIIADVCSQYASDAAAYAICACGVPWAAIDMSSPECGCGYGALGDDLNVQSTCFTGGKTLLVFFSVLIGGFGIGQAGPGLAAMSKARVALAKLLRVINRTPAVDQRAPGTQRMGQVSGAIEISDLHFSYKRRVDAKELKDADISGPLKGTSKGVSKILPLDKKGSQGEGEGADAGADGYEMTAKVFEGLNISIKPGETVALVGESGCGKSTIAKLVQRFYDPDYGTISIDGKNLCDVSTDELRACIGVVSQEPFLFDVSISENIGFGKAGASQAEIEQAARQANAHDFICAMPDGYSTTVGPRGSKLSGGQKQRVAIARALLRDPAVLILDEATSALDNESERIVQEALDRVLQSSQAKRTTLVIAHRLSTVRNSDRILVLGSPEGTTTALKGSVVMEQGSHDELMKKNNGLYRALVAAGGGGGGEGTTAAPHDEPASVPEPKAAVAVAAADPVDAAPTAAETESIGKGTEKTAKDISEKVDSQGAKDKAAAPKIDTSRIWHYSAPEYPLIALGCVASACKGCIFPVSAVFFAEMINVWYESDTDALMAESLNWSYCFYGLAVFACVAEVAQKGIFQLVGERLTTRLRIDLFAAFLSQDIGWFELDGMTTTTATATATVNVTASTATEAKGKTDKTDLTSGSSASSGSSAPASGKGEEKASENNSVGALISRLSTDVYYVRLVTGQSVAATLETVAALTAGIVIACLASWEIFLVMLAMMPLLGMTEFFQWQALQNNDGSIREALKKCISTLNETVNGIREVQAFALQGKVREHIQSLLDENVSKASMANALYSGLMQGMIQLIQFGVYALAFYVGGQLIVAEQINFGDFNRALWAMAFAASGLGTAAQFAGDSAKASLIIKELLAIIDRKPWPIASEPWDRTLKQGKQPPELLGKPAPVRAVAQSPPGAISAEDLKAEAGFSEVCSLVIGLLGVSPISQLVYINETYLPWYGGFYAIDRIPFPCTCLLTPSFILTPHTPFLVLFFLFSSTGWEIAYLPMA
jgi:ATP-binding cassette subfamily B (MDR/TAP) protein 1